MTRTSVGLTVLTLLVASATFTAWANTQGDGAPVDTGHDVQRTAPRPGPDFPSLDSYYPPAAKRAGQQGTAVIHVCVDSVGKLTEPPTLASSSGNNVLDDAAVNLATVASGHYLPASEKGVPVRGCGAFRIAFKLRPDAFLPLNDPRFPTISGRIGKLDAEFNRRMEDLVSQLGRSPVQQIALAPGDPAAVRAIRQYARSIDSFLDESVGLSADFLDDIDYLEKSPDIPEAERARSAMERLRGPMKSMGRDPQTPDR